MGISKRAIKQAGNRRLAPRYITSMQHGGGLASITFDGPQARIMSVVLDSRLEGPSRCEAPMAASIVL